MATYKVLQDIEAEDKLLGPLTARQCIYAAIGVVSCYLSYLLYMNRAAFLIVFLLPFIGFGFFFAFPWTKQQSTEVWALARVRFALKPRRRIWDQNGTKNLVTVTVPVQVDPRRRNMSETEVVSRLQALANTIDSRGWAVKNVPVSLYAAPSTLSASDRLVAGNTAAITPGPGTFDSTDIFDIAANPRASELETKMAAAANSKRQQLVNALGTPAGSAPAGSAPVQTATPATVPARTWYTPQPAAVNASEPTNLAAADEALIAQNLRLGQPPVQPSPAPATPVTPPVNPAILELANNNDLNIATIAREAKQINGEHPDGTLGDGEVSVSLR